MTQDKPIPLAERLRPNSLAEVVGQPQLTGQAAGFLETGSLILWGPPGSGKTTIARILGQQAGQDFTALSAVFLTGWRICAGFSKIAEEGFAAGRGALLFVDGFPL